VRKRLPRVTAADTIRALEKAGFFPARQSGSHKIYKNQEGKRVTVPYQSLRENPPPEGLKKYSERRGFNSGRIQGTGEIVR
jgi:predicted RNA binding protein YcfA (HicA-like mRNA interferase family)